MQVLAAFLADEAQATGGRLDVRGACWDSLTAPRFPARHPLNLVLLLQPARGDRTLHAGVVEVTGPQGELALRVGFEVGVASHAEQVPVVISGSATFTQAGRRRIAVTLGAKGRSGLEFDVHAAPVGHQTIDWAAAGLNGPLTP